METVNMHNLIILDESGSMEEIKKATISGFNEVVQTIRAMEKEFPEQHHFITLVSFNGSGIRTLLDRQAVSKLKEIDGSLYQPNSSTPLFDAIGQSLVTLKHHLSGDPGARVLVTILTDGEENASKEYNAALIQAMIDELKLMGWTFTYIGANHDVELVALSLSITNTMTFKSSPEEVKEMFIKEKSARVNYSRNIREGRSTLDKFYENT